MKIDRLIAITIYLLSRRENVSASELAKRFEVSKRTIQRDINILNAAGVPIVSTHGAEGGYAVIDGFRIQKQIAGAEDYENIIVALRGLVTACGDERARATLDKMLSACTIPDQRVFLDLSSARGANALFKTLEASIQSRSALKIGYQNAKQSTFTRVVEPLALAYQWYSWYLFAFCTARHNYRLFKLARILECENIGKAFSRDHSNVEGLLKNQLSSDTRHYLGIKLLCQGNVRQQVLEYLTGQVVDTLPNGDFTFAMHLPESERMWFSLLLGFGNTVEVLEPEGLRTSLRDKAAEVLSLY